MVIFSIFLNSLSPEVAEIVIFVTYGVSLFFSIGYLFYNKKKRNKSDKRWLMKEIIDQYGKSSGIWFVPFQFINIIFQKNTFSNLYFCVFISVFLVCVMLYSYIMIFVIHKKSEEYLLQVYPEYAFVK